MVETIRLAFVLFSTQPAISHYGAGLKNQNPGQVLAGDVGCYNCPHRQPITAEMLTSVYRWNFLRLKNRKDFTLQVSNSIHDGTHVHGSGQSAFGLR